MKRDGKSMKDPCFPEGSDRLLKSKKKRREKPMGAQSGSVEEPSSLVYRQRK